MKEFKKSYLPKESHSAKVMGSGTLNVLATPAVVAFAENCCERLLANELKEGQASVGTWIDMKHKRASKTESKVVVCATIIEQTPKGASFEFEVTCGDTVIATGQHKRAVIDVERFMANI
ncbi:thioesterase family protein [Vagococcus fessus]|uniref:Fluoroacetyl-CoA-specific thioesterase-like domain-containing protein n=1 Tax=Vagococcus fessus TaxID=120370 RepID=A0A430ABR7_9ENTE|nr:hotdog domain-containing protein [Vagococcus fessus]RSU04694.1 hypothetical protein CBF31_01365 [Vagococcus fessus]